ncbi:MAG: DUF885 domain-containing protein [Phenylobacterium sp.]|uniref:DUF885 domain-containing protein n=1 Tax=Phenylobacterium sp. TaxID=1871053 RepID=UPI00391A3212
MPTRRQLLLGVAATALAGPATAQAPGEEARLEALLDRIFQDSVDESPERATSLGLDKGARAALKARLDDRSSADKARRLEETRARVAALRGVDRAQLSDAAKVDLDVVLYQQETALNAGERYSYGAVGGRFSPYVVSQQNGAYQDIPDFLDNQHRVETTADAEAWLSRLSAFAVAMDQDLARMGEDMGAGVTPPDFICDLSLGQMRALRGQPAEATVLVTSLAAKADKAGLGGDYGARAARIVQAEVFPALDRQIAAMERARGAATSDAGVWKFKDGAAYYADAVKALTTTSYTPDEVHALGLEQVADITGRLDGILKSQGYTKGTVAERLTALGNEPSQLYPNTDEGREAMLAELNARMQALDGLLPRAFRTLPKASVSVKRVPPFIQDGASNGYYQRAALDGSRPAAFFINLKDTHDWPKFGLATLAYHEASPGHHLQISLAQESTAIPLIRRTGGALSACTEGWALYAEQLADELGVYENDPLGRAGYLQSLLFRASRLVIDTGLHHKRWSREKATQYMVEVTGYPVGRSQREVERYCAAPGQACSYKVGHTVWVRSREAAKAKLGPRFDLREFHDAALLSGAMPLTVLERHIADWAAATAA